MSPFKRKGGGISGSHGPAHDSGKGLTKPCPACSGQGHTMKFKKRIKDGKTITESVRQVCSRCHASGFVAR